MQNNENFCSCKQTKISFDALNILFYGSHLVNDIDFGKWYEKINIIRRKIIFSLLRSPSQPDPAPAPEFPPQYSWVYRIFPFAKQGKKWYKGENSPTALQRLCSPRQAAQNLASCWAEPSYIHAILHKLLQLSRITMQTLTVTPFRGSFGLAIPMSSL